MIAMMVINPAWGHVAGAFIVLMMASFIGIWIWAWRKRHKTHFDRMAQLPLEDESKTTGEDRP